MAILRAHLAPWPTFLAHLNYGDNKSLMGVVVLPCGNFHSLLNKLSDSRIFFILINYAKYLILENSSLAMKHDNSSLLPFTNSSITFSSMHCYFEHFIW
jgi:hypothetical protein